MSWIGFIAAVLKALGFAEAAERWLALKQAKGEGEAIQQAADKAATAETEIEEINEARAIDDVSHHFSDDELDSELRGDAKPAEDPPASRIPDHLRMG